jgi:Zn ribbon nucleic-acid-binding protein
MAWTQKRREEHAETMKLAALFRRCKSCERENATTMRREPKLTIAVCAYCGHEAVMARYS